MVAEMSLMVAGMSLAQAPEASKSTVLELVLQYVVAPLIPAIGALILTLLGMLTKYLAEKGKANKMAHVAAVGTELMRSVVADLEVTMRPALGKALEDGQLTAAEREQIKQEAIKRVRESLPPHLRKAAGELLGPMLTPWLSGLVERAHSELEVKAPVPQ